MNIKILEPISEDLVQVTLPFGSRVYGTAGPDSDYDYIKILKKSAGQLVLQYQNATVDYVYTDLNNFLHLATTGGNIPMFEALLTPEFVDEFGPEGYVLDIYATAKAYLGLAKRDLHYPERLHHAYRCYWCAMDLILTSNIGLSDIIFNTALPLIFDVDELNTLVHDARTSLNKQFKKT